MSDVSDEAPAWKLTDENCHSLVIGGVLCRWWGDQEPEGARLLLAIAKTKEELDEGTLLGVKFSLWHAVYMAAQRKHIGIADVPAIIDQAEIHIPG